ncbi:MAG: ATP-binding protein [Pseudomonadota bacterium]
MNSCEPTEHKHRADDAVVHAELLPVVSKVLEACLARNDWREACAILLQQALKLTRSECGFIGIIVPDALRVLAHEGLGMDEVDSLQFSDGVLRGNKNYDHTEFFHFNRLIGQALKNGEAVIANMAGHDKQPRDRSASRSPHLSLHSVLAVPIFAGNQTQGVVVLANRLEGYSAEDQQRIETLLRHVGGLSSGYQQHAATELREQERLATEAYLQTSDAQLRRIAGQTARLGGWTIDLEQKKLVWSDEVCAIHDLPPGYVPTLEEGLGYFPPDVRAEVVRCIEACATNGTPYDLEIPKNTASGRRIWVRSIGEAVRDSGGRIVRLQGAFQDITERKQIADALRESEDRLRQSQKMEAIGRLAGGIAHDFNNLLTVINGYSENMMELTGMEPVLQDSARMINEAGTRAAGLTSQLLGFSRRSILSPQVLDINAVVLETCELLRRLIGEDIQLHTQFNSVFSHVRVDSGQMNQVLMNIAINARDAMPQGGTLTITTADVELGQDFVVLHHGCKPGPHVMLTMTDTGVGMTPDVLAHSFEPFFTTKEVGKGSGLGLAMVFGIVEQSGGLIQAASEPGRGTTFRIYIPALIDPLSAQPAEEIKQSLAGTETILLVEDEPTVRKLLQMSLESQGYKILTAIDGEDGLHVIQTHQASPDLVLTDMTMPNLGGSDMVAKLKEWFPQLKVLFMSGYIDVASLRDNQLSADAAFIQKPFSTAALFVKVRQLLDA